MDELPWNNRPSGEKVLTPRSIVHVSQMPIYRDKFRVLPYSERVKNMVVEDKEICKVFKGCVG